MHSKFKVHLMQKCFFPKNVNIMGSENDIDMKKSKIIYSDASNSERSERSGMDAKQIFSRKFCIIFHLSHQ